MKTKMPRTDRQRSREQGVALVTTMIVVAVLAVVAVAFMQSTSTDRLSSRTAVNYVQARLVAEAGAAAGEALVADLVRRYPDSVTVWQNIGGGAVNGTNNEATVLYVRAQSADTNLGARPAQFGGEVTLLARPLVSLEDAGELFPLDAISSALPSGGADMVNLNATNSARPRPFIGLRSSTNAGAPVTAAQWVYFGANPGPTNATNPAVARYAFWVEDESFKVNVNVVTNGPRGGDSLGLSPAEARLDGAWGSAGTSSLSQADAGAVVSARSGLPGSSFPTALTASLPGAVDDEDGADELKFLTTVHSAGLDLSRGGFKRFNINSITNGIPGPTSTNEIRTNLSRIIAAITNSNSVPNFGQRFYRLNASVAGVNATDSVSTNHEVIYLNKIAANILDYADLDDQPTIINSDPGFSIRSGRPEFGIEPLGGGTDGPNSVVAMGVENMPRLQEYAIHGRIRALDPIGYNASSAPTDPVANYRISIDHYFEFWNPGTQDITITNAFLKVYGQPSFGDNITGPLAVEGRDFELPVDGITFPAGQVTVLTTAPQDELNELLVPLGNRANVVHIDTPDQHRIFEGQTRDTSIGNAFGGNGFNRYFTVSMNPRSTGITDYESAVLFGNENGILESFVGLPIATSGGFVPALHFVASSSAAAQVVGEDAAAFRAGDAYYTRSGSLLGNSHITAASTPSSTEGDPRSLNEQMEILLYRSGSVGSAREQTRFFLSISGDNGVPGTSSIGGPNTTANYVRPTYWIDYSSIAGSSADAPLSIRNGAMQSIGELGHVTDPARVPGTSGTLTNVVYSRGGGRTLRIGQSEHPRWYDGNQNNASRTWTSWRLADIFTTTAASNSATAVDPVGNLTNSLGVVRGATNTNGAVVTIPGLINPNGLLRDGGLALRAALHSMTYLPAPEGVPGLAGKSLTGFRLNSVVNSNIARLTNATAAGLPAGALNPFWERGEISELPIFNSGNIPTTMSNQFDRGREELVRRSIEMITTRGSIFTVYAIGQTLQGTNVTSVARINQTFQIEPQFATADAFNDSFNPAQPVRISRRFAAPTNYTIRVLATSYD